MCTRHKDWDKGEVQYMLIIWKEVSWNMRRTQQYNAVCADVYTCKNYVPSWDTSWINYMLFFNNMPAMYIVWSYFNLWSGHHTKFQVISYIWQIHNLHIITMYFYRWHFTTFDNSGNTNKIQCHIVLFPSQLFPCLLSWLGYQCSDQVMQSLN